MIQSTIKEVSLNISKIKEMEVEGLRNSNDATLGYYLVKIYKLWSELKETIDAMKTILLERKPDKMFFWEDEMKVFVGDKNSTSIINVKEVYKEAQEQGMVDDFFKVCSITQTKVDELDNIIFKSIVAKNKKSVPGEKNAELKIGKITKEEKLLNV